MAVNNFEWPIVPVLVSGSPVSALTVDGQGMESVGGSVA